MDKFTEAMFEAALFAETDGDEPLDKNYGLSDFAKPTRAALEEEARRFQEDNEADIAAGPVRGRYPADEQAGHDFWLTRNGHGAGFWDGDWPEPAATRLTKASKRYGQVDLYVGDDGKIHASGYERGKPRVSRFNVGNRVELHPATDRWMMGDRYGEVVGTSEGHVKIKLDKSGKTLKFREEDVLPRVLDGLGETSELYDELVEADIPTDSHESDLYVLDVPAARKILEKYPTHRKNATRFKDRRDGKIWIDVPFAYAPFWRKKRRA